MPVKFNSQYLIPAPLVTQTKSWTRRDGGRLVGHEYQFTLAGTIVNVDNSQDSPGASGYVYMEGVLHEQERLRNLFNVEGGLLEIIAPNGTTSQISTYAIPDSLTFDKGTWVNRCDYEVILKTKYLDSNDQNNELDSFNESWGVNENEDGTFSISHQIEAKGVYTYINGVANNPLNAAKQWVNSRTYNTSISGYLYPNSVGSGSFNPSLLIHSLPSGDNYWNRFTVENVDPDTYSWSVTENFIYNPSGSTREEFSASVSIDGVSQNRANISINGSVFGYYNNLSARRDRYTNAKIYYFANVEPNLYTRLLPYTPSGYTLSPLFLTRQVTHEPDAGNVRYSANFTSIMSGTTLIPNSIDESINVVNSGPQDIFATLQIPGRGAGSLIQYMHTKTLAERTISISATIIPSGVPTLSSLYSKFLSKPNTDAIINALKPAAGYFYLNNDTEEFSPIKNTYSRNVSWVLDAGSGSIVAGTPSGLHNTT